ncbi:hypothetical protein DV735_g843, partial [Chaetothyriales sp. CBS 134920]
MLSASPSDGRHSTPNQVNRMVDGAVNPVAMPVDNHPAQHSFGNGVDLVPANEPPTNTLATWPSYPANELFPDMFGCDLAPDWLNQLDFDLPDLFQFAPAAQTPYTAPALAPVQNVTAADGVATPLAMRELELAAPKAASELEGREARWFSFVETPTALDDDDPQHSQNNAPEAYRFDDRYRGIAQRELSPMRSSALPPTSCLNRYLRQATTRFLPMLPILHLPTFRPRESNAWLLIALCSLGSQLVDTTEAHHHGQAMFENLHRAVLSSWTSLFTKERIGLPILQAVILAQTFAMLSASPYHLLTALTFHGSVTASYRRATKMLERRWGAEGNAETTDGTIGLARQALMRIGHALSIQDSELALLSHQAPLLRAKERRLPASYSDRGYYIPEPPHAQDGLGWRTPSATATAQFGLWDYVALSNILASVVENRFYLEHNSSLSHLETELCSWLRTRAGSNFLVRNRTLRLDCLWHSGWLAMLSDLDMLEIALGREGVAKAQGVQDSAAAWAGSEQARRALMHAFAIQRTLASVTLAEVPAIHVPRSAYHAGLVLCSLAAFAPEQSILPGSIDEISTQADIKALTESGLFTSYDWQRIRSDYSERERLVEQATTVASLLRRLGTWGLSRNLAATLEVILSK